MRTSSLSELMFTDFNVSFLNVLQQFWRDRREFQCLGAPKRQNLLLFLDGCSATYIDRNGEKTIAHGGDVILTSVGSEYRAVLSDFRTESSSTIGVNFLLYDEKGEPVTCQPSIEVFRGVGERAGMLFRELLAGNDRRLYIRKRLLLMEILSALAAAPDVGEKDGLIVPGLQYLADHPEEKPSVAYLAQLCHVSEAYFRRRFKERTGVTPVEYRNELRLARAAQYLEYGDVSIQELSGMLGYSTASHFIQQFKKRYGVSPLAYRKRE